MKFQITNEAFKLALDQSGCEPDSLEAVTVPKNSEGSFQVILQDTENYSVTTGTAPWFSEKGKLVNYRLAVHSPFPVTTYLEGMLADDTGILKADILERNQTAEFAANTSSAIWVDICVPAGAEAGSYEVIVQLFRCSRYQDEEPVAEKRIRLKVCDVTLEENQQGSFFLDLWQHNSNLARHYDVPLWSDAHFAVIEQCLRPLAELGQKSVTVVVSEIPWSGQRCYANGFNPSNLFEYSMIPVTKDAEGSFRYDFSILQRYIDLCAKLGIREEIAVFGLVNIWDWVNQFGGPEEAPCQDYPEAILIRYFDESTSLFRYMRRVEEITGYIAALEQYFKETGQIDRVRIVADEPADMDKYRRSTALIQKTAPSFRLKTAINHSEFIAEFGDNIDDFVPSIQSVSKEFETIKSFQKEMADKRFLWYVCCEPEHPNTFLRNSLLEARFIGIWTEFAGFDGFLRWAFYEWPAAPRQNIRYCSWPAGDLNLIYPAGNGEALLSMRYKALKRGIEDYLLLQRLKAAGKMEVIEAVLSRIVTNKKVESYIDENGIARDDMFSHDYHDYEYAREAMLAALE